MKRLRELAFVGRTPIPDALKRLTQVCGYTLLRFDDGDALTSAAEYRRKPFRAIFVHYHHVGNTLLTVLSRELVRPHLVALMPPGGSGCLEALEAGATAFIDIENATIEEFERAIRVAGLGARSRSARHLLERGPVIGVLRADLDGQCIDANPQWSALTGLHYESSLGRGWQQAVAAEYRGALAARWKALTEFDIPFRLRLPIADRPGARSRRQWMLAQGTFHEGYGYVVVCVDISHEMHNEDRLRRRERALLQQRDDHNTLLAQTSHELKSPLTALLGLADRLLHRANPGYALSENDVRSLATIRGSARRMSVVVNDLLELFRGETRELQLNLEPVCLREILKEVVHDAKPLKPPGLTFDASLECGLCPGPCMAGDAQRLHQVFTNLVINAFKFTRRGRVLVRLWREADAVCAAVRDSGSGIAPEQIGSVFKPFVGGSTALGALPSHGLGLSVAQRLVALHGGKIWVHWSEPGQGTEVRVSMPMSVESSDT